MVSLVLFAGAEREKAKAPPGEAGLSWGDMLEDSGKSSNIGRPGSEKVQEKLGASEGSEFKKIRRRARNERPGGACMLGP